MSKNTMVLIGMMLAVGLVSAIVAYFRTANLTAPQDLAAKGLNSMRTQGLIFFGVFMPLVVGLISFYVLKRLNAHSPETALKTFHTLALSIGAGFTILAALVFKMRGFVEFTFLHILYIILYGWVMPILLTK